MTAHERLDLDAIDPTCIDSVTGDSLIAELRRTRETMGWLSRSYGRLVHNQIAVWLAVIQGEPAEAAQWMANGVDQWIDTGDMAEDPWAYDWRKFWQSRDSEGKPQKPCMVCGDPATTFGAGMAACGTRHWRALKGELSDEQCGLCNEVRVCAHDLDGSPVCADCWPGDRLMADRREAWRVRMVGDEAQP